MQSHGSNVAGEIVVSDPRGTVEELRHAGLNPAANGSCAPPSMSGGVRGCPVWNDCPFHLRQMGGFKGKTGPHYIGYYIRTHEGKVKEDEMACFSFVKNMLERMYAGQRDRQKGLNGEHIAVVAQEGEIIKKRYGINVNDGTNLPAKWVDRTFEVAVTRFARPGERDDSVSYEQELADRMRDREARDPSMQTGPPPRDVPVKDAEAPDYEPAAKAEAAPIATAEPIRAKR